MLESVPFAMLLASADDEDPAAPERSQDHAKLREYRGVYRSFAPCFARILMLRLRNNIFTADETRSSHQTTSLLNS